MAQKWHLGAASARAARRRLRQTRAWVLPAALLAVVVAASVLRDAVDFVTLGGDGRRPALRLSAGASGRLHRASLAGRADGSEAHDPSVLSVPQIKAILSDVGLPAKGTKAKLVSFLKEQLAETSSEDYSKLTKADLAKACKDKGIDAQGTKKVLVERLASAPSTMAAQLATKLAAKLGESKPAGSAKKAAAKVEAPVVAVPAEVHMPKAIKDKVVPQMRRVRDIRNETGDNKLAPREIKFKSVARPPKARKIEPPKSAPARPVQAKAAPAPKTPKVIASRAAKKKAPDEEVVDDDKVAGDLESLATRADNDLVPDTAAATELLAARARKEKPAADAPKFAPGDTVVQEGEGSPQAVVQLAYTDGSFLVTWSEDGSEDTVDGSTLSLETASPIKADFHAGDHIKALCDEDEEWYPAVLVRNNGDGTYTAAWDEDRVEVVLKPEQIELKKARVAVKDLVVGQKFKGKVRKSMQFGTLVDFGAARMGLLSPWRMHSSKKEAPIKEGDAVRALFENGEWADNQMYEATVQKVKKDGTYEITWDEDGEEDTTTRDKMELVKVAELISDEEGEDVEVDVWISSISARSDGEKDVELSLVEDKVGVPEPAMIKATALEAMQQQKSSLKGTVTKALSFGVLVDVPDKKGAVVPGLLLAENLEKGYMENFAEEFPAGKEVDVIVKNVDHIVGRLSLAMADA